VGSLRNRSSVRLAIVAIVAVVVLGSTAVIAAATATSPLLTYIAGLGSSHGSFAYIAAADGSSPTKLGPATSALLSPDGTQVAAIDSEQSTSNSTLLLYPVTSGLPARPLAKKPQFMQLLAWSMDSRLLLVAVGSSTASTPGRLVVFDVATGKPTTIASGTFDGASFQPTASDQIVFARESRAPSVDLYITSPSGAHTRQLTHDGHSAYPVWGSRGIIYSHMSPRAKGQTPARQLWLIAPGSGSERALTNGTVPPKLTGLTPIDVSADGAHLLANYVGADHSEAYTLDLSNLSAKTPPLRDLGSGTIPDAISAKGDMILVTKGTLDNLAGLSVETIKWGGGKPTAIVAHGAYASWDQ
jgi:hypothetical protein